MCRECARTSRRGFLSLAAGGAAFAAGLGAGRGVDTAAAQTALSPDEALARLKAGNAAFVTAPQLCAAQLAENRASVATGQSPWATILTCADSRVAPELIFGGVGLGELFVARNAGNIADTDVLGTIEYGADYLGSPLVVVMGHSRCGAVQAACAVVEKQMVFPGSINAMVAAIVPAAEAVRGQPGDFVENAMRENARRTAEKLLAQSEIISRRARSGQLKVVYAEYDLDSGAVRFLG